MATSTSRSSSSWQQGGRSVSMEMSPPPAKKRAREYRPAPARRKRPIDEPTLMDAFKKTKISCGPGELRMKNDVALLQHHSDLVKSGVVGVAQVGPYALILSFWNERYVVAVPRKYPFEPPTVKRLNDTDETVDIPLLRAWSAVYTLEDVAAAIYEKSRLSRAIDFELYKRQPTLPPPPLFSRIERTDPGDSSDEFLSSTENDEDEDGQPVAMSV